ncbi:uncharacterized protein B0T15DRAFT_134260 [Chaetomium strumarium]|uniref:Zn(2)-C6 fungal-type domain-containing protein n=1 Tax=Chaetomium strumarium TaxID=1170767 RepID=A0AAJ0M553_9PEZI|nr:hypothetical protein B0T15DRAFT_134260 [Chaetomium strumarium]
MPPSDPSTATTTSGPGSPPRSLAKFGCARCRKHHLKCDRVTPTCGRCLNAGKTCNPPGLRIRETNEKKFKFTQKQKWVRTPRRLVFIDESRTAANDASSPDSGPDDFETVCGSPTITSDVSSNPTPPLPTLGPPAFRAASPPERLRLMMISSVINPPAPSCPSWPLTDREEARLFRHFVEKLAVWLDLCDPKHTFETIVPQQARDYPVLLNAMFALSARHLGQTHSDGNMRRRYNQLADMYNEACINIMKDALMSASYQSGWTEQLFAATIILQVMEEMNAALHDESDDGDADHHKAAGRGHIPGMHKFVQEQSFEPGTLGAASFWIGLRQEIYSAVEKRQPVGLNLVHPGLFDRSLDEADEYTWANRAVVHCADVLNFSFDPGHHHQPYRWDELNRWNQRWSERKPRSYDPIFREHPDSAVFPEIWYHRSCQVIGVTHHLLARLFLLSHQSNPAGRDETQESIRKAVREICGIGCGNQWTPPGIFTACMAISAFGSYFDGVEEQDAMLAILEQTQRNHARPTERVILHMLQVWGRYDALAKRKA